MDTWSRPEQNWTKPPQTREDIAKKPCSSWTKQCKKARRARRTIKSDRSSCFQYGNSFGGRFRLTAMKSPHQKDEKERSAWASSRTTAEAPQMIAICPSSF